MGVRELLRGRVAWDRLEAVVQEVVDRYDAAPARVEFLDADNWLSTPFVVDERYFVKVISNQNSLVHALFTTGRNLGAFTSGTAGFFEHFGTPLGMAEHELEATARMREAGVDAPEPLEAFEVDGLGVVVLEYLPEFHTFEDCEEATVLELAPRLFESLALMHDAGLGHGDLRAENVLVTGEAENRTLQFIDATKVQDDAMESARAYDLACALAVLVPLVGPREAVAAARQHATDEEHIAAREFLDFVNIRPDHTFDATTTKGEIERVAA